MYKDFELLGHVHGILTDSQTEHLCTLQRANDDDFGYGWLRTKEEILSLNNREVQQSGCGSSFTLIDSDDDDNSDDGNDDLPF